MTPKQHRQLWVLGGLVVVLDVVCFFTFGFSVLLFALALTPLAYGIWLAIKWSSAWERRHE